MITFKYFFLRNRDVIFLSIALSASFCVIAFLGINKIAIKKEFDQQASEMKALQTKQTAMLKQMGVMQSSNSTATATAAELQSTIDTLKKDVGAFALQAASCNLIKKRFHIKDGA